jgi:hypothetical protein
MMNWLPVLVCLFSLLQSSHSSSHSKKCSSKDYPIHFTAKKKVSPWTTIRRCTTAGWKTASVTWMKYNFNITGENSSRLQMYWLSLLRKTATEQCIMLDPNPTIIHANSTDATQLLYDKVFNSTSNAGIIFPVFIKSNLSRQKNTIALHTFPGVTIFYRITEFDLMGMISVTLVPSWPIFCFCLLCAIIAGMIMWVLVSYMYSWDDYVGFGKLYNKYIS